MFNFLSLKSVAWALTLAGTVMLAACSQPPPVPHATAPASPPVEAPARGHVIGVLEVHLEGLGTSAPTATARVLPAGLRAQATTVLPDTGINFSRRAVSFYDDDASSSPARYTSAIFEISNTTTRALSNLSLYAISVPGTLGGTALAKIFDATGAAISDAAVAQSMIPTHGMNAGLGTLNVNPDLADLQVYRPGESRTAQTQAAATGVDGTVLQYGFVARNLSGGRAIAAGDGASCTTDACKGQVTLAYRFPKVTPRSANPWAFTLYFLLADETVMRVTRSAEEDPNSAAAVIARAQAFVANGAAAPAEIALLGQPAANVLAAVQSAGFQAVSVPALATTASSGGVHVSGRIVIPEQFLDAGVTRQALFAASRVWLFDPNGTPLQSVAPDGSGTYSFANVPANVAGQRIVATFGSDPNGPILEASLASLSTANAETTINLTLRSSYAAEVNRDPALKAAYAAALRSAYAATPEGQGRTLDPVLFPDGAVVTIGADMSSLADGGDVSSSLATSSIRTLSASVCTDVKILWFIPAGRTCAAVPDVNIEVPGSGLTAPSTYITIKGSDIAKKITYANRDIVMKLVSGNTLQFYGANGVITVGGGNVITLGGGNLISNGLGSIITLGGGNVITAGGGNVITAGGGNLTRVDGGYVLKPGEGAVLAAASGYANWAVSASSLISNGLGSVITLSGGNVITAGGANLISNGMGSVITAGGGNLNGYPQLSNMRAAYKVMSSEAPASTPAAATGASTPYAAAADGTTSLATPYIVSSYPDTSGGLAYPGRQLLVVTQNAQSGFQAVWQPDNGAAAVVVPFTPDAGGKALIDIPAAFSGTVRASLYLARMAPTDDPAQAAPVSNTVTVPFVPKPFTRLFGTDALDRPGRVTTDASGNIYVAEIRTFGNYNNQIYTPTLDKFAPDGTPLWSRSLDDLAGPFPSSLSSSRVTDLAVDPAGNAYLLTGVGSSLVKFDAGGNRVWQFPLYSFGNIDGRSLALDGAGGLYLTGAASGSVNGESYVGGGGYTLLGAGNPYDLYLLKLDSANGTTRWARELGTTFEDAGQSVAADSSGNVYVAGYSYGDFDGHTNTSYKRSDKSDLRQNMVIVKFDAGGTKLWSVERGSNMCALAVTGDHGSVVNGMTVTPGGNVVVTGSTQGCLFRETSDLGNAYFYRMYVAQYGPDGTLMWGDQPDGYRFDQEFPDTERMSC